MFYFISYPRSGSNYLLNIILETLNKKLCIHYMHNNKFHINKKNCNCDSEKSICKTHDFLLDIEINDKNKYFVLLRKDKYKNIEAYLRLAIFYKLHNNSVKLDLSIEKEIIKNIKIDMNNRTHKGIINNNIERYVNFYKKFYDKYSVFNKKNILVMFTEDIIENVDKLLDFFDITEQSTRGHIKLSIKNNFKFNNDEVPNELINMIMKYL